MVVISNLRIKLSCATIFICYLKITYIEQYFHVVLFSPVGYYYCAIACPKRFNISLVIRLFALLTETTRGKLDRLEQKQSNSVICQFLLTHIFTHQGGIIHVPFHQNRRFVFPLLRSSWFRFRFLSRHLQNKMIVDKQTFSTNIVSCGLVCLTFKPRLT